MGRLFLGHCAAGDIVEEVFVVSGKQFSPTTTGKHFIKCFVSDRTLQLNARMWNATRDIFNAIPDSGFLRIRGRIENYQNNLQLIIEQMWPAKAGAFDVGDLLPHTTKDVDQMCQQIFELCGSIQNRHLAAIIQAYLDDEELMTSFCKAPAAASFHHAYIGGLLEHTLNAMQVANATMPFYPGLNRDLVLAGIFLHDIAKTWELSYDTAFSYTDGGQLVGHIVKSAIWVEKKVAAAEETLGEKIPQALVDVLQHIILAHHGEPQFGAARTPSTPEAIAVHHIENFDAKMMMALGATRGESVGEGNWTDFMKAFGGRLYRPDVAPEDAPATAESTPEGSRHEPPPRLNPAGPAAVPQPEASPAPALKLAISNPLFESAPARRK